MHYLGYLSPCDIVVGAEVGQVVGRDARLAWHAATRVATDDGSDIELGGVGIESRAEQHILELLTFGWVVPAKRQGGHLG